MIKEKLKQIIASDDLEERKELINEFQEQVWNGEINTDNPAFEILSELAHDLDFYEPDENLRKEDSVYYGDEKLMQEISSALEKMNN